MHRFRVPMPRPPRYRIERAGEGYRVVGKRVLIWEETLREAADWRDELESPPESVGESLPVADQPSRPPDTIIYGPVVSRRLGRSLGVNLTPRGCRVCSFDCVYCEFGSRALGKRGAHWPSPGEVGSALAKALRTGGALDSITISGHGEPTLHPRFGAVVAEILGEVSRARSGIPLRILTNGTRTTNVVVQRSLDHLDERIVTLDAGADRVNRPGVPYALRALIAGIRSLRDVTLQSCFVSGPVSNCDRASVSSWADLVGEVRPRAVQIYTINRQPAVAGIRPVSAAQLEEIACLLRTRTGIEANVFS